MRRLTLVTLAAALAVGACTDRPTEPSLDARSITKCGAPAFPHTTIVNQIKKVFPPGLRGQFVSRSASIKNHWDACRPGKARQGVVDFIASMNAKFVGGQLVGTEVQQNQLIAALFAAVGLTAPPIHLGLDFGIGVLDPNATTPTLIKTAGQTALIEFQPSLGSRPPAFNELTIITIDRRLDDDFLAGFPQEDQLPPFFDYSATNASNNHVLNAGSQGTLVFCLLDLDEFPDGYPDGVRIGHDLDPSVPGAVRSELIPEAEVGDFVDDLTCANLQPTGPSIGLFSRGLPGFANAAWHTTGRVARTLLLPARLSAAAVGTRGPLGGLPPSLSDFGVVVTESSELSSADVLVFNDINMFDNTAAADANNIQLFKNLVNFTTTGSRSSGTSVLIHQGHGSLCDDGPACGGVWTTFAATMTGQGYTVVSGSDVTSPLTTIGSGVKVIILAIPTQTYSNLEINSLKAFAGEGGRIVYVGEHQGFYGETGIPVENDFLSKMGSAMVNTGGSVDCFGDPPPPPAFKVLPSSSLRSHQAMNGLSQLTIACASVVVPGPDDQALFYNRTGVSVLGAVAKIDLTPVSLLTTSQPGPGVAQLRTQGKVLTSAPPRKGVSKAQAAANR